MDCQHQGCHNKPEPFEPATGAPVQWWCEEHAYEGGFCFNCGSLEAGHEEFEIDPNHMCLECQLEFIRSEHYEEPVPECDYPGDL
jgi:hypothetical protein